MRCVKILLVICMVGIGISAMAAGPPGDAPPGGGSANPFQDRLDDLAAGDRTDPPEKNGLEFVGSSMFEGWTEVAVHMAPLPAFNRSIGGSKTGDILRHLDQLVLQYEPKVVVLYSGINDVSEGISPEAAAENIRKIMEGIKADLPRTRIVYIAMIDTANRPGTAGLIEDADTRIRAYAESNPHVTYLDIRGALVDEKGDTRPEFLDSDKAHYNASAYEAMAREVKPAVEAVWPW